MSNSHSLKSNKNPNSTKKTKKKAKVKPEFFLLENGITTKMSSPSNSPHLEGIAVSKKAKTRKKSLKIAPELVIMDDEGNKRLNEEFIDLLDKLSNIMLKQGEIFRSRAYQKAQETIMAYPDDIFDINQLKGLPGIGTTIMEKLKEYVETGTLKVIEREKNNPVNILGDIYGIGPKKAKELVKGGITTLQQLQEQQDTVLNAVQKQGLKYYDDIMKRIPRSEIVEYEQIFTNAFEQIPDKDSDAKFEIVGSFRRGALQSGDIDVIITGNSNKTYNQFIDILLKEQIILVVLSRGGSKCLVITKLPGHDFARRVDFLYTSPQEYPFAVLYFTGSKIFNTVMRQRALNRGYTFNEHGIYVLDGKKKGDKVNHDFLDEKSIFDFLEMNYMEPEERKDGRAVQDNNTIPININTNTNTNTNTNVIIKKKQKTLKQKLIVTQKANLDDLDNIIQTFKKIGINVLDQLTETQLVSLIEYANQKYYNQTPLLSDNEYDIIKEYIENKYPANPVMLEIGAPIEKNKVKLPYPMPSMDKIKPDTGALESWTKKYTAPYVISCKVDGVSALYTTEGDNGAKLYTRGNGTYGQDISYLIPHLRLPKTKDITIRGELLITKEDFAMHLKDKFANPRNLVSGIVNQKKVDPNIKYVHFVAYEVIHPELKPSEQMKLLETLDIDTVLFEKVSNVSNEFLSTVLVHLRKDYIYEIDGIIVTEDKIYPRKSGNPEHSFAFKMILSDQIAEAKVVDVIWTPSKDGYLKPRVRIEPIQLGGVTIEYATGFNADFIYKNKIGIGALIEIIRSGDVIPHIRSITVPAEEAKMPSVSYKWNATHVDILLEDLENDPTVKEKNIAGFFKGIHVDGLSTGNIHRIINAGYDTIPKIVHMTESDFLKVEGFKQKLAHKIFTGIQDGLKKASLVELMSTSNLFGRGISEKKIELIMKEIPDILSSNKSTEEKVSQISNIKGYTKKSAEAFLDKVPIFLKLLEDAGLQEKLVLESNINASVIQNHPLTQKTIVLTGLRDKELMDQIKSVGGIIGSNVSKNTFAVIAKHKEDDTGKASDARKLNIPILTVEEFIQTYFPSN